MKPTDPLDRFTILRELGRGATGAVYAARDQATNATAALKTLDPALLGAGASNLAKLFLENARAAARLRHANILRVLDAGEAGGTAYVLTELAEGKSLRQMLADRPLPVARAIRIFDDVASALAYAHEEGMLHRGVRPSNIFVLPEGTAKIGDFGIGQVGESATRYLSPEQVRGETTDHRTDLYSLGAVFYEMLTHRAPFGGRSAKEIRENILRTEPRRPSEVNPTVPAALDGMVLGLLARNPDERPASARDVLRDLQRLEEELGLRPARAAAVEKPRTEAPKPAPQEPVIEESGPTLRSDPSQLEEFRDQHHISAYPTFDERDDKPVRRRAPEPPRRSGASNALAVLAIALAVFSIGLTVVSNGYPGLGALRALVARNQEAPPPAPAPTLVAAPAPQPAPLPVAEKIEPEPTKTPPIAQPQPIAQPIVQPQPIAPAVPEKLPPAAMARVEEPAPVQEKPQAKRQPAPRPAALAAAPKPAKLVVAVAPRGEVYVDGKHAATAEPAATLDLEPGLHRIEIRNGSRRPYLNYVVVEPGEQRQIRYDFNAKGHPRV
jgi:serine/threonine-protein kinase